MSSHALPSPTPDRRAAARQRRVAASRRGVAAVLLAGGAALAVGSVVPSGALAAPRPAPVSTVVLNTQSGQGDDFIMTPAIGAARTARGTRVVARIRVMVSAGGIVCGRFSCLSFDETVRGHYIARTGLRIHAVLQRALRCPERPPAVGPRVVSAVQSLPGVPGAIDLPPGMFTVTTVFPPRSLARGVWSLCTWYQVDPSIAITNPVWPAPVDERLLPAHFGGPFEPLKPFTAVRSPKRVRVA